MSMKSVSSVRRVCQCSQHRADAALTTSETPHSYQGPGLWAPTDGVAISVVTAARVIIICGIAILTQTHGALYKVSHLMS